jgi:hypothetical protein
MEFVDSGQIKSWAGGGWNRRGKKEERKKRERERQGRETLFSFVFLKSEKELIFR